MLLSGFALAQEVQRTEIFGGYSYLNADTNGLTSRQSASGWDSSVSVNLLRYVAVEGDVSGYYRSNLLNSGVNVWDYGFLAGPRFNFRQAFVHALFGVDRLTGSTSSLSASQNSFATAFGGGVQMTVAPHYAVRTSADWLLTRHNLADPNGPSTNQNSFRVSVGLVYRFGPDIGSVAYLRKPANKNAFPGQASPVTQPIQRSNCGTLWNCTGGEQK
jgi:hypothetical protein